MPDDATLEDRPPARSRRPLMAAAVVTVLVAGAVIAVVASRRDGGDSQGSPPAAAEPLGLARASKGLGVADAAVGMPIRPATTYRLDGTLPQFPAQADVYGLHPDAIDAAAAERIAQAFGMSGRATAVDQSLQVADGPTLLVVQPATGTFTFGRDAQVAPGATGSSSGASTGSGGSADSSGPTSGPIIEPSLPLTKPAPKVAPTTALAQAASTTVPPTTVSPTTVAQPAPSAARARDVAVSLLQRAGIVRNLDDWDVTVTDGMSTGVAWSCPAGADCPAPPPPVVTSRMVTFTRVVDGITAHDATVTVDVGAGDVVDTAFGTIADVERDRSVAVRSAREVYDDLVAGKAILPGPQPLGVGAADTPLTAIAPVPTPGTAPAYVVTVTGATRGYVQWPTADGAHVYLVPTYRFTTRDGAGTTGEIEALALTDDAFAPISTPPTAPPGDTKPVPEPAPAPLPGPNSVAPDAGATEPSSG